ncbi:MAG: YraN family protein [Candidatus Liptonbacteria bacterium]|nr:YraN family protein [Candidatus Liptonbacteria bacterium]
MFSAKHLKTGSKGEDIASKFLEDQGYKIITRNYRKKWGEIDIIARDKDKTLVFAEVKTLISKNKEIRQSENNIEELKPEDNLTKSKLLKLEKTCSSFANRNPNLISEERGWRIDLITILLLNEIIDEEPILLTNKPKDYVIKHYQNISSLL